MKELKKIIAGTLCFMQSIFIPNYILNNDAYFLDFCVDNYPLRFFFKFKSFLISTSPAFGVLNYDKQHKEGICKVLGKSVVFSAFLCRFLSLP